MTFPWKLTLPLKPFLAECNGLPFFEPDPTFTAEASRRSPAKPQWDPLYDTLDVQQGERVHVLFFNHFHDDAFRAENGRPAEKTSPWLMCGGQLLWPQSFGGKDIIVLSDKPLPKIIATLAIGEDIVAQVAMAEGLLNAVEDTKPYIIPPVQNFRVGLHFEKTEGQCVRVVLPGWRTTAQ